MDEQIKTEPEHLIDSSSSESFDVILRSRDEYEISTAIEEYPHLLFLTLLELSYSEEKELFNSIASTNAHNIRKIGVDGYKSGLETHFKATGQDYNRTVDFGLSVFNEMIGFVKKPKVIELERKKFETARLQLLGQYVTNKNYF